mmetsp:Transcript_147444/g.209253  ORF Transcript_147444/g.209253 Transcript_147444/m.209253 type:complete len:231 (+) Transcript_147444:267-959(+)
MDGCNQIKFQHPCTETISSKTLRAGSSCQTARFMARYRQRMERDDVSTCQAACRHPHLPHHPQPHPVTNRFAQCGATAVSLLWRQTRPDTGSNRAPTTETATTSPCVMAVFKVRTFTPQTGSVTDSAVRFVKDVPPHRLAVNSTHVISTAHKTAVSSSLHPQHMRLLEVHRTRRLDLARCRHLSQPLRPTETTAILRLRTGQPTAASTALTSHKAQASLTRSSSTRTQTV